MTRSIYHFDAAEGAPAPAVARLPGEQPRIGVIRNARSRHNLEQVSSAAAISGIKLALPQGRAAMAPALAELARGGLDLLVIDGGDGTVRDVLTLGAAVFGDDWPVLAVLPKGKTNALALDLGAPAGWRLPDALAAFAAGRRTHRRPLVAHRVDGGDGAAPPVRGFILGAGAFTLATRSAQDAHRAGLFNAMAVATTSALGVAKGLFGSASSPWRKGSRMRIATGAERTPVPRSRHGDPAYRAIVLATTLQTLPMGARPFGPVRPGLKLGVMDVPLRRILLAFPLILTGRLPSWLARAGYRVFDTDRFDIAIDDGFIIDGELFPPGTLRVEAGPPLTFVTP